ncbi:MAG: 50S ribosomal protein L9 [Crocinitomicaceae bacterium]|jgi:large subunit ribosomal protein L9|nr:50S ribosomal protein L9 [Crocinitomicaceae bacterium]MDG2505883.1 50S ribosomal protein L9 [Crocinitomicaceae bacterium]
MEVILKKNVNKLGYTNDIVSVKPGYGRNFLIPQGYAVLATASAKKAHAEVLKQKSHKEEKLLGEAQAIAEKIGSLDISIATKAGDKGKIFGSINTIQLSDALKKAGFEVDRKSLKIKDEPIKELGSYEAEVNLYKGVIQTMKFEVVEE